MRNKFMKIFEILLTVYIFFCVSFSANASEGDIEVYECRLDSDNNLIVSGINNYEETIMIGLCISHSESKDIVAADQITAACGEKFSFSGINFKTDGSMKTGLYDIQISDGKIINIERKIYIASDNQLKRIFKELSAENADIAGILKMSEDNVTYGEMLSIDMKSFEALKNTDLFSEIISKNRDGFTLKDNASNDEVSEAVSFFKNVFNDALALQEYQDAENAEALKEWFLKYQSVNEGMIGYDERYDFSGGENSKINDIRIDMESADKGDSVLRMKMFYEKLYGFVKLDIKDFKTSSDESEKDNVIDYLLWKVNRNYIDATILTAVELMPASYGRNVCLDNEEYVPFKREYYNKLSSSSKKNSAIDSVMGVEYKDIEGLCEKIEEACENAYSTSGSTDTKKPPGGSSGGGGGSSIGAVNGSVINNITKKEDVSIPQTQKEYFNDLTDVQWAKESIESLYNKGAINGFGDCTFRPNNNVTRAEFVKMIVLAFELKSENIKCEFHDIKETDWFYEYIAIATELGIVNGVGDGNFSPERNITREELSTILFRTALKAGYILDKDGQVFADNESISDYAKEAVLKLNGAGIINGVGDGSFAPKSFGTRAQAAKMIYYTLNIKKTM